MSGSAVHQSGRMQLMPSAEAVTSSWELGIIEIELSIRSSEIMASDVDWDAAAQPVPLI
jgi:hypothetical protein